MHKQSNWKQLLGMCCNKSDFLCLCGPIKNESYKRDVLNGDVLRRVEHDDDYDLIWVVD